MIIGNFSSMFGTYYAHFYCSCNKTVEGSKYKACISTSIELSTRDSGWGADAEVIECVCGKKYSIKWVKGSITDINRNKNRGMSYVEVLPLPTENDLSTKKLPNKLNS